MRTRISAALLICLAGFLTAGMPLGGCSKDNDGPEIRHPKDFLPTTVSSWELSGEIAAGTTAAELQTIINGGYQFWWNHNMKEFAIADFVGTASGGGTATIRIYEYDSTADAQALFNDPEFPMIPQENPTVGDLSGQSSSGGVTTLWFTKNQHYAQVEVGASDTQYAEQQSLFLATSIDSQMQTN